MILEKSSSFLYDNKSAIESSYQPSTVNYLRKDLDEDSFEDGVSDHTLHSVFNQYQNNASEATSFITSVEPHKKPFKVPILKLEAILKDIDVIDIQINFESTVRKEDSEWAQIV